MHIFWICLVCFHIGQKVKKSAATQSKTTIIIITKKKEILYT